MTVKNLGDFEMALNCSRRPMLPSPTSEKVVRSPISIMNGYVEDVSEKKEECYSGFWNTSQGEADVWNFTCGENSDRWRSPDLNSDDIVDSLPTDPFGMDMKTTFTAINGWLEDLEVDYAERMRRKNGRNGEDLEVDYAERMRRKNGRNAEDLEVDCAERMRRKNGRNGVEDYSFFAEWDFFWNNSLNLQTFPSYVQFAEEFNIGAQSFSSNFHAYGKQNVGAESFSNYAKCDEKLNVEAIYVVDRNMVGICNGSTSCGSELKIVEKVNDGSISGGSPNEALAYALGYLGVKDLLSVENVCRSLCSSVRGDPLLWMDIHIDRPLNEKVTDDDVVKLVSRAQGNLQCLNLMECHKLTDDGIKRILESNSRLTKLSVPGCTRLTIEGMVRNIKIYNSNPNVHGIKHLRIGGLYGITQEHYEELTLLLGADHDKIKSQHKPHFYQRGEFYLPYDDGCVLDIDMCPICEKFRLVYDCPAENCRDKKMGSITCRGCTLCIPRCAQCGRCVKDTEYEETFCLELLCSDCF